MIRVFQKEKKKGYLLVSQLWLFPPECVFDRHIIKTWKYIVRAKSIFCFFHSQNHHRPSEYGAMSQGWKGPGVNRRLRLAFVPWAGTGWWHHLKWPGRLLVWVWAGALSIRPPLSAHLAGGGGRGGGGGGGGVLLSALSLSNDKSPLAGVWSKTRPGLIAGKEHNRNGSPATYHSCLATSLGSK